MVVNMPMCNIYMKVLSSKKKIPTNRPYFFRTRYYNCTLTSFSNVKEKWNKKINSKCKC